MRPHAPHVCRSLIIVALSAAATVGCAADARPSDASGPTFFGSPSAGADPTAGTEPAGSRTPASPSGSSTAGFGELEGSTWRAIEIDGRPSIAGAEPTLTLAKGAMEGSDGCNVYTGPVSLADGRYQPGELNRSLMACPDTLAEQAEAFIAVMREPGRVGFDTQGRLVIGESDHYARFVPAAPPSVPPGGGG